MTAVAVGVPAILETTHAKLASHIPTRFVLASGSAAAGDGDERTMAQIAISDLVNAYAGEIRELEGEWRPVAPEVLQQHGEPSSTKDLWNGNITYFVFLHRVLAFWQRCGRCCVQPISANLL